MATHYETCKERLKCKYRGVHVQTQQKVILQQRFWDFFSSTGENKNKNKKRIYHQLWLVASQRLPTDHIPPVVPVEIQEQNIHSFFLKKRKKKASW